MSRLGKHLDDTIHRLVDRAVLLLAHQTAQMLRSVRVRLLVRIMPSKYKRSYRYYKRGYGYDYSYQAIFRDEESTYS